MPKNIVEKILTSHLVCGEYKEGERIGIRIDQTLTQDATGTMVYLQFESLGIPKVKTELSVSYIDHNTLQDGFENADDHRYLQSIADKYGLLFSKAGNGICHQVHLERFGIPGKTLLGSDSHTPTGGGLGMIAIGAGGLDIALALAGTEYNITVPKVIKVNLTGKLRPMVSAKDVILKLLSILSTKGNVNCLVEYGGEGVSTLTIPERATITNMGAELGVTTSVFPSDETTKAFLKAQKRESVWTELRADEGAGYFKTIDINLSTLIPMIAQPHSPDNVVEIREIKGKKIDQVCIGSCTNSSFKDIATVSRILKGKKIHKDVSLVVIPGSKQVFSMAAKSGDIAAIVDAGARVFEPCCGFCIGMGQAPATGSISLRTNNRNFFGRSGTKEASIYLLSPEAAAYSAISGVITDPTEVADVEPANMPDEFFIDDSLVYKPTFSAEIKRGPNIGDPPKNIKLPLNLKARVTIKLEDKITTDHIMPAGSRLKYRSNIKKYSEFVFESLDPEFHIKCQKNVDGGLFNIIVARDSYGQGSSREHAAICPMFLGVKAVVAVAIERIHKANLINFGILPLQFINKEDYSKINANDEIEINLSDFKKGKNLILKNKTSRTEIPLAFDLNEREIAVIKAGGRINFIKDSPGYALDVTFG